MWWYFIIWICVVAYRRAQTYRLLRQGFPIHSHYAGYPTVGARLFRISKENQAKNLEIGLVLVIGGVFICTGIWEAQMLGGFIFTTAFALMLVRGIEMQMTM